MVIDYLGIYGVCLKENGSSKNRTDGKNQSD